MQTKTSISKTKLLKTVVLIIVALLIECCTPRIHEGVATHGSKRAEKIGSVELLVTVVLLSSEGRPMPGVSITAQTVRSTDVDTTNSHGEARVNVVLPEDGSIDFHFLSGKIDWMESLYDVPMGVTTLKVVFHTDNFGRVRLKSMEY